MCDGGPEGGFHNCVHEVVEERSVGTTLEAAAVVLSPQVLGLRVGVGYGWPRHRFDVSRTGRQTGRTHEPGYAEEHPDGTGSWLIVLEGAGLLHERMRVNMGVRRFQVEYTAGCRIADHPWVLCGKPSFTRYQLGIGYDVR